ncbi:MAG: Gfo/Idh/MocA family oxidoreductase [Spirochaetes bacterium]|nr:Gfo/Idh/MocA family oxidoreductase [Spirochaetota bacterium]
MNVAIIGYGGLGKLHARNLGKMNDFKLTAICDINYVPQADNTYSHFGPAGTAGKPEFTVYEKSAKMFKNEKIDIVIDALPSYLHTEYNIEALENGCHVFTEKPFALTVKDCEAVIRAAKENRRTLMVGHCMRFWPGWKELKEYMSDKRYGKLRYLSLRRMGGSPRKESWFSNPKKSGGVTMDLHIHDVDFANYLFGKPRAISASGIYDKAKGIDVVNAQYRYNDAVVKIENGWIGQSAFVMEYQAVFDNKVLTYEDGKLLGFDTGDKKFTEIPVENMGGHQAELAYFLDCVKNGKKPAVCLPEHSRDSIALALAGAASMKSGRTVSLKK